MTVFLRALRRHLPWLAAACALTLAGCSTVPETAEPAPLRPEAVRALLLERIPAAAADRGGWAADIQAALTVLEIPPTLTHLCAVVAVVEQESSFRVDPTVPNLGRIAREEIDRRAQKAGVPGFAVDAALSITSSDGRTYAQRIAAARTERELSRTFDDFIGMVPLGRRLLADYNPVRTGGPMQVSIAFAERHARRKPYPYPLAGSIRDEVFTRRGGLYFGIAHLLDYPAAYDQSIHRFADFNAGHYASRNAAFQHAVSVASGITLTRDGDLIRRGSDRDDPPGATELAVRTLGRRIGLGDGAIRSALEKGDEPAFEETTLYRKVFELAERTEGRPLPRAMVPTIALSGPKITRPLTTEWFARRVEERQRRCMGQGAPARP